MADIRYNNSFSLAGGFNITNAEPIDSRMYVADIQHIYSADNWEKVKPYPGLIVAAPSGEVRICVNSDYTKEESWKKIGGGNVSVETFAEAEELAVEANIGQVIFVSGESIAYIVSGEGVLMKLATSTAGDIDSIVAALQADLKALQGVVGTVATDEAEATGLIKDIADNAAAIAELKAIDHDAYIEADEALKLELQGEMEEALEGKVDVKTYEDKVAELEGEIADAITTAADDATSKANAAQSAAEEYADGLNAAMNTRVETLEGKADAYVAADEALKLELQGEMEEALEGKVDVVEGSRLMTEAEGTKLAGIAVGAQVNIIESVKVNGNALEITDKSVNVLIPECKVKGVDGADKMLSLSDNGEVKSELSISYVKAEDSADGKPYIALFGKGGTTLIDSIDATEFVKDGMIETVKLIDLAEGGKALQITWNTDAGKEVLNVPVGDLMDYYYEGDGIKLGEDRKFSVDLKEGEKFLVVDASGLGIDTTALWGAADEKYDAKNAASNALTAANEYTDGQITELDTKAQGYASDAQTAAQGYADGLNAAMNTRVEALEGKADAYVAADEALKSELQGEISTAKADAISAATAYNTAMNTRVEALEGKADAYVAADEAVKQYADDTFVSKTGFNEYTEAMEAKLNGIEENAEVNVIEKVIVNGIEATIAEGTKDASVKVDAKDIELGVAITGKEGATIYSGETKISTVLQGIQDSIRAAVAGGVNSVTAADNVIDVNNADPNNPKVSIKVETSSDVTVAAGHIELIKGENGLYGAMYYEGDDAE